jgi:primosomal replication protein N
LRYTPAGIPILRFALAHESEQLEAGIARKIDFELACVAVQREAQLLAVAPLGTRIQCEGFLAPKGQPGEGRTARQLILHVSTIEFGGGEAAS